MSPIATRARQEHHVLFEVDVTNGPNSLDFELSAGKRVTTD